MQFSNNPGESLDSADAVYNRINASIDKYIEQHSIDAPSGTPYEPVWGPEQESGEQLSRCLWRRANPRS